MTGKHTEKRNHINLKCKVNHATFSPTLRNTGQYFEIETRNAFKALISLPPHKPDGRGQAIGPDAIFRVEMNLFLSLKKIRQYSGMMSSWMCFSNEELGILLSLFSAHLAHAKLAVKIYFQSLSWEILDIISLSASSCRILGALGGGDPRGTINIEEKPFIHEHGRREKY